MAVSLVALVVAPSGGAYAAVKVMAPPAPTITVCVRHVGGSLYRAKKCAKRDAKLTLAGGVLTDKNFKPNSLTGASINASTLGKVPSAGSADNADALGGTPAVLFPVFYFHVCGITDADGQNGTIKGKALIDGAKAVGVLSTSGVISGWVCTGQQVLVKKTGTGTYQVTFGSLVIKNCGGEVIGIPACPSSDFAIVSPRASTGPAGLLVSAGGPRQCAPAPPPYIHCVDVFVTDLAGTPTDGTFTIALL